MEVNPFKIGPLLLCYNEEPFFEGSVFYRLHDRLKKEYNFFISSTSTDIENSRFLQNKINALVSDYENHCYVLSDRTSNQFMKDLEQLEKLFEMKGKDKKHLCVFDLSNDLLDKYNISESIKVFNLQNADDKEVKEIAKYFISVIDNPIIRFDLEEYFGIQSIIRVCSLVDARIIEKFSKNPQELQNINRRLFEVLVAEIFDAFGFDVELTKRTRDGGRDIVAIKNKEIAIKYLIECKRPDIGNKVGVRPVRELLGVKSDEKATKAILATTSYFTSDARMFFERNKWELEGKDYDGLIDWIEEYKKIKKWK